ncbi:BPL-N domain-containing protein [uncultured Rubinisphaera sp.]|uniref:BPL-N domain-containing protein n=1 Tax=uncultured Rubinisphaera sp. TaxID=1678686 RepID=UPI0030D799E3
MNKFSQAILLTSLLMLMAMPTIVIAENVQLVRVAIYDHSEEISNGPSNLLRFLIPEHGFSAQRVSPEQIQEGCLKEFDVLIMPGGSGSKQSEKLQESGRAQVKEFVRNGGGYVGICAGSYLASSHYSWSLSLINAKVWDREHWARGQGTVSLCLTSSGCEVLGSIQNEVDVYYGQGPLLVPDNQSDLPGYEVLASYGSEIAKKGAPVEAMIDTHAVIRSKYGEGRVICFSPHPETKDGPNSLMASGIYWAAQVKP